jgi:hypothetical protein
MLLSLFIRAAFAQACQLECSLTHTVSPISGTDTATGTVTNTGAVACDMLVNLLSFNPSRLDVRWASGVAPGQQLVVPGTPQTFDILVTPLPGVDASSDLAYGFINDGGDFCRGAATMCALPNDEASVNYTWHPPTDPKYAFRAEVSGDGGATFQGRRTGETIGAGVDTCYYAGSFFDDMSNAINSSSGSHWIVQACNIWGPFTNFPQNADNIGTTSDVVAWCRADRANYTPAMNQALCLPPYDVPGCVPTHTEAPGTACGFLYPQQMYMGCSNLPDGAYFHPYNTPEPIVIGFSTTHISMTRANLTKTKVWP